MWTNFKRVIRSGFVNFWRNSFVSLASILVMVVTLFMVSSLLFSNYLLESELKALQERVDINVYFSIDAPEEEIVALKEQLENLPEVGAVTYTSRDEVLRLFRERHEDDQLTLQGLDELADNPFGASLSIRAKEISQYEGIAKFLDAETALGAEGSSIIDSINYYKNKTAIDRLTDIINQTEQEKLVQAACLALIAALVTFNTIRLAIYNAREEIGVMRLVGASNMYIRGPFVVEGLMYGVIAAITVLVLLYPITFWLGSYFNPFPSFSGELIDGRVFSYYISDFLYIFVVVIGVGAFLGVVSSYIAVRKYLNV